MFAFLFSKLRMKTVFGFHVGFILIAISYGEY